MEELHVIRSRIHKIRGHWVMLDRDLAEMYEVEMKDINKAVRNNPDKFPEGYIFELQQVEKRYVVENLHHFDKVSYSPRRSWASFLRRPASFHSKSEVTNTLLSVPVRCCATLLLR